MWIHGNGNWNHSCPYIDLYKIHLERKQSHRLDTLSQSTKKTVSALIISVFHLDLDGNHAPHL
jgi:hypothetical protein